MPGRCAMSTGREPGDAWHLDAASARAVQRRLAAAVRLEDETGPVTTVAGVDTGFTNGGQQARACVAVHQYPDLTPLTHAVAERPVTFPYRTGLLAFRELPAILAALNELSALPDLLLCDGQGIAHPRRLGIAAHLGVWLDRPSVGVGKSRLLGSWQEPGRERGSQAPLHDGGERIGTVLRSRTGVRPLFVSPGHRVDHAAAPAWVLACTGRYRLPEPIRAADRIASQRGQ